MLIHIVEQVRNFSRLHDKAPNVLYLNPAHYAVLRATYPEVFADGHPERVEMLGLRIVIAPASLLPRPVVACVVPGMARLLDHGTAGSWHRRGCPDAGRRCLYHGLICRGRACRRGRRPGKVAPFVPVPFGLLQFPPISTNFHRRRFSKPTISHEERTPCTVSAAPVSRYAPGAMTSAMRSMTR